MVNAATYLWTTSGTGKFSDPLSLNPLYTPSAGDILNGGVVLTLDGTHKSRWSLCSTIDGTYADTLTLPAVHATNVVFYAKAKADSELPANDITVSIVSTANIKTEV